MWIWMALASACLLGVYDVAKKKALKTNGVLWILFGATLLTTLILSPCLSAGSSRDHLMLMAKACIVTISWVSGLAALNHIPITTASTIKATRPMIVVLFSIILFGERLNIWQWTGVAIVIISMYLLSRSSKKEGISFATNKGVFLMVISVLSGAASALYDKYVISLLEPLFVQSWTNLYITIILAVILLVKWLKEKEAFAKFKWDWTIVLIGVFITISDCLYFFAIKQEGSLLSMISLIRRCSVIITFILGGIVFKEHNLRSKGITLGVLMVGMALLMYGSSI